jgi:hypothetical protein
MIEAASSRRRPIAVATIAIAAAVVITIGVATPCGMAAGPKAKPPSSHANDYLPSISDLMIATIQSRHDGSGGRSRMETGNLQPTSLEISAAHSSALAKPIQPNTISPFRT